MVGFEIRLVVIFVGQRIEEENGAGIIIDNLFHAAFLYHFFSFFLAGAAVGEDDEDGTRIVEPAMDVGWLSSETIDILASCQFGKIVRKGGLCLLS